MNQITDEKIVAWIIKGKTEYFRLIVERYQNNIFAIGKRILFYDNDAYDLVQEVFIKAYENITSYKKKAPFHCWLFKIAYNHAINTKKKAQNKPQQLVNRDVENEDPLPEELHIQSEVHELLMKAVERLPKPYQVCIDLYFFAGLRYSEIHDITSIPVNTIKSNVLRAKQMLRKLLEGTIVEDYHAM